MPTPVPFKIYPGLPFAKTITAALPPGRDWWTELANFEVLSQIRKKSDRKSDLLLDLADCLTTTLDDDLVTIELVMPGSKTKLLLDNGYHDLIISDTGTTDGRAYVLIGGPVRRMPIVTKETAGLA